MSGPAWPRWIDALPAPADGSRRAEGGRRLRAASGEKKSRPDAPLVSYVTVVRNGAATLGRTLASVQAQRWHNVEHIVVDGLSDDGTLALIERHADRIDYYVSERDGGLYEALNKAVPLARGDLVCVLNADDWLTADAARLAVGMHRRHGPAARRLILSAAWAEQAKRRTLWLPQRLDAGAWMRCANACHNAVYATRGAYEASGPYAAPLRIAADFRWLMRCVDAGVQCSYVDLPTVHYAMGGLSADTQRHTRECQQVLRERFPGLSDAEAWGLMHAFHQYRPHLDAFAATRPPDLQRFVAELTRAHAGEADLLQAVALAAAPTRLAAGAKLLRSLKKRWAAVRCLWAG
jgi:hypothetical protein